MKRIYVPMFVILAAVSAFGQPNPDVLWSRFYGGEGGEQANAIEQTADGGYIIAGWTTSFGEGNYDIYVIKTDSSGDTLWTRTYGGARADGARSIRQTSDGGYIIAGWTSSFGAGGQDVYVSMNSRSSGLLGD